MRVFGEGKEALCAWHQSRMGLYEHSLPSIFVWVCMGGGVRLNPGDKDPERSQAGSQGLLQVQGDVWEVKRWPGEVTTSGWRGVGCRNAWWNSSHTGVVS